MLFFDRAIGLDQKYAWAIAYRGETYRLKGDHEQALADFDHAIGVDEQDAWAIASRGETNLAARRPYNRRWPLGQRHTTGRDYVLTL